MVRGFANMLNWLTREMEGVWYRRHEAWGFERALAACGAIYSGNPCELTGLAEKAIGKIGDGSAGDLVVLSIEQHQGNYAVQVDKTIVDGKLVYDRDKEVA